MTVHQMKPGTAAVTAQAMTKVAVEPRQITELPGGLYPLHSAAFEMDEYRIMAGWPVPVPGYDIRVSTMMSADGTQLADRDPPTAVVTGATYRWLADPSYYDETSLRWIPIQGDCSPWVGFPGSAPTLVTDYEYRVGDERFTQMSALNFDSDTRDYLENDLSLVMGGVSGYTLVMVMSPTSIYGNNPAVPSNGLWGPPENPALKPDGSHQDPTGQWFSVRIAGDSLWLDTEDAPDAKGVSIGQGQRSTAPLFLALALGTPQAAMFAASGPSSLLSKRVATGAADKTLRSDFWLGRSGLTPGSANMALLDLGIYGNVLSAEQVAAEFALLSGAYGGDT